MLYSQEVLVVGYGHFLVKSTQAISAIFDGKSLFEMTVDRNRAIADTYWLWVISTLPFE
jgi:hypothetical protein